MYNVHIHVVHLHINIFWNFSDKSITLKKLKYCTFLIWFTFFKLGWPMTKSYALLNFDRLYVTLFFSCLKSKHFFLFNYVPHLFLLTCVKFHGKKIDNNFILTHICLPPFFQMAKNVYFSNMKKIIKHYPVTDRVIVRRGYQLKILVNKNK
jgi:hypothetical protein